jgi:hypothetical protein
VPVLRALKDWSETHIEEIFAARDEFDARAARRSA